jgi:hypothetical protein
MIIDDKTYALDVNNYVPIETNKRQIVIGHTFNHDMRHVTGWKLRYNGYYKKTAAFTISAAGLIYKHFEPKYYSNYLNNYDLNTKTIVILMENDGWLIKDSENNQFLTWVGDIYKQPTEVVEKRWRGLKHWAPYSQEQMESAANLVRLLCDEYNIPISAISHNTKIDRKFEQHGILYKSNLEKYHTDLNPTWNCELFKNKLENYEREH